MNTKILVSPMELSAMQLTYYAEDKYRAGQMSH
jgi:hypothetical protein